MLSIWNMAKRYIAAAIVGALVAGLAHLGIDATTNPELTENIRVFVDSFLMGIFYVTTILVKTWQQKKVLAKGDVLPERVESVRTASEHVAATKTLAASNSGAKHCAGCLLGALCDGVSPCKDGAHCPSCEMRAICSGVVCS